jgi:hypothetical protein
VIKAKSLILLAVFSVSDSFAFDNTVIRVNDTYTITKKEEISIEKVLPATLVCIQKKTPKKCGIDKFMVNQFNNKELSEIFINSKVTSLRKMFINNQFIIDVTLSQPSSANTQGGVIWFVIEKDKVRPIFVSFIANEL